MKHILNSILKYYYEGQIIFFTSIFQNHILLKFETYWFRSCLTGPMFPYNLYFHYMTTCIYLFFHSITVQKWGSDHIALVSELAFLEDGTAISKDAV